MLAKFNEIWIKKKIYLSRSTKCQPFWWGHNMLIWHITLVAINRTTNLVPYLKSSHCNSFKVCSTYRFPLWEPGPWFNIKLQSYQYRKSHCGDKTVIRSSYLYNGISHTGKMTSLYWMRTLIFKSGVQCVKIIASAMVIGRHSPLYFFCPWLPGGRCSHECNWRWLEPYTGSGKFNPFYFEGA